MNKELLIEYCKSIHELFNIPVMIYNTKTNQIDTGFLVDSEFSQTLLNYPNITDRYLSTNIYSNEYQVSYYISDDKICFGSIKDKQSSFTIFVGPCLLADPTDSLMHSMLNRSNSPFKDNPDKYYDQIYSYIKKLPKFTIERFLWLLSFTNNFLNQEILDPENFYQTSISKNRINLDTLSIKKTPVDKQASYKQYYSYLQDIKTLILNGSISNIEEYWTFNSTNFINIIKNLNNNDDLLRNDKNTFIQFISYFASILIENNISEKQTMELIEKYTQDAENAIVFQQIEKLYHDILIDFTKLVNKINIENKTDNILLNKAINYIHDNITDTISSLDIAENIGISRGYLSTLFNNELKVSINDYINSKKILLAKSLLDNSDNSVVEISNYLGFSSQSYFQNIFKKYTNMTPLQYRKSNKNPG